MTGLALGLEDARVLVTGGGTGIGRATALQFARLGANVAVLGSTGKALEGAVEAWGGRRGSTFCVADIRDHDAVTGAFAELEEEWGGVELVNNAGGRYPELALEMSINGWRWSSTSPDRDLHLQPIVGRAAVARVRGDDRQRHHGCCRAAFPGLRPLDQRSGWRDRRLGPWRSSGPTRRHRQRDRARDDQHPRPGRRRARGSGLAGRPPGRRCGAAEARWTAEEVAAVIAFSPRRRAAT